MHACILSHCICVQLFATLLIVAQKDPVSSGLARQEYWSMLLYPLARDAPHLGIKRESSYISVPWEAPSIGTNVLYLIQIQKKFKKR